MNSPTFNDDYLDVHMYNSTRNWKANLKVIHVNFVKLREILPPNHNIKSQFQGKLNTTLHYDSFYNFHNLKKIESIGKSFKKDNRWLYFRKTNINKTNINRLNKTKKLKPKKWKKIKNHLKFMD